MPHEKTSKKRLHDLRVVQGHVWKEGFQGLGFKKAGFPAGIRGGGQVDKSRMIRVSLLGMVCRNQYQAKNFAQLLMGYQKSYQGAYDHP
jgi:hypothetical protein